MPDYFKDKVAIVTGGSSGIGRACCVEFARKGAKVVVADINREMGDETVRLVKEAGADAFYQECDVGKPEQVKNLVNSAVDKFGRLDFAVNNAGIGGVQVPTAEYPLEVWDRVININLNSVFYCMKYEILQMLKQNGGAIVNMSSILGKVGFVNSPAYVAAKHGVLGLTKTAALEYATRGIRINAICPAFIYTPLLEQAGMKEGTDMHRLISELHAMRRMGTPEEVANAVIFLCSDKASFITGESLLVDGGYTAQ